MSVKATRQWNHATLFPLLTRGPGKHSRLITDKSVKPRQDHPHARLPITASDTDEVSDHSVAPLPPGEPAIGIATVDPWPSRRIRVTVCLLGGTGLVLIVVGSFLPWVVSGTVRRSSYAIIGVIDRLGIAEGGVIGLLVTAWPFIGLLCMTPVIAGCLRSWRVAGLLGVLVGLASGLLSFGIVLLAAGRAGLGVRLDPIGPAVMAAGAVLVLIGGGALSFGAGSPVRR